MHHVGITLHHHFIGKLYTANFSHSARIISTQVNQHKMLGQFFRISQQFFFHCQIFLLGITTSARASDWPDGNRIILKTNQDFRRRTDYLEIVQIKEIHVRRRIEAPQCAIQIKWSRGIGNRQALRKHHLHAVTLKYIFLNAFHCLFETVFSKTGNKISFIYQAAFNLLRTLQWLMHLINDVIQAPLTGFKSIAPFRLSMNHDKHTAAEIIENNNLIGNHQ